MDGNPLSQLTDDTTVTVNVDRNRAPVASPLNGATITLSQSQATNNVFYSFNIDDPDTVYIQLSITEVAFIIYIMYTIFILGSYIFD